ncbi:class I SAM-dependent methyltransferase [Thermosphaera chiliense]|uniref:Class I SAM-dependent methyltransferase n=1 Tax=Thermosphaera chiliense TaxID=3402707 RepID=A0A7M1UPP7_9CREN|nr:class I SAM-dependent methyltransferase [Thermosphaera aggregans]QOR93959.1 class I SAM-dependent methyltransferase [Thermosphaera aggregans]
MIQRDEAEACDWSEKCWNICGQALFRTLEYFRKALRYREAGWKSIDVSKYLKGRVLDVGAGRAGYLRKNISYQGLLVLMDPSYDDHSRVEMKTGNVMLLNADGLDIPLMDESFDVVISLAVLHHIPTRECRLVFLKEIQRVLVAGGLLILSVWFPSEKPRGKEVCDGVIVSSGLGDRFYHFYSIPELKSEVESAGFRVEKVETVVENPRKPAETRNILLTAVKQ